MAARRRRLTQDRSSDALSSADGPGPVISGFPASGLRGGGIELGRCGVRPLGRLAVFLSQDLQEQVTRYEARPAERAVQKKLGGTKPAILILALSGLPKLRRSAA